MQVLDYLLDTREKMLVLESKPDVEEGYVDAGLAGDLDNHFSTSGCVFFVYGRAVHGQARTRTTVATSTVEAEFIAARAVVNEAAWLQSVLKGLSCAPWSVQIQCDNEGCIQDLPNPVYSKHANQVAVQLQFAQGHHDRPG